MKEVNRAKGRRNRSVGIRWERYICRHVSRVTGLKIERQLEETRGGNLGDSKPHPRVPMILQAKSSEREYPPSIWKALEQAEDVAAPLKLMSVGVMEHRKGVGRTNVRNVAMFHDDWVDLMEEVDTTGKSRPVYTVTKTGRRTPHVWDGLDEVRAHMTPRNGYASNGMHVCIGRRDEGRDVVLFPFDDFLWVLYTLVKTNTW